MNNRHLCKMCQRDYESLHLLKHAKNKLRCDIYRTTTSNDHDVGDRTRGKGGRKSFHCIPFLKSTVKTPPHIHIYTHTYSHRSRTVFFSSLVKN